MSRPDWNDVVTNTTQPLEEEAWPVSERKLLTAREQTLYRRLIALYPGYTVFIQVALSQLIAVEPYRPDSESIRARYKQLVADFVLCRPDLSVVAVIELDDRSHLRESRQRADARKTKALTDAGIRLVRIAAGPIPSEEALRSLIDTERRAPALVSEPTLSELHVQHARTHAVRSEDAVYTRGTARRPWKKVRGISRIIWIGLLQAVVFCVFASMVWFTFTRYIPVIVQESMRPLGVQRASLSPPQHGFGSPATSSGGVASEMAPHAEEIAAANKKRLDILAAADLQRQKAQAWAAFYSAPGNCEHPVDWNAQVECGNQYMRAKRRFEVQWEIDHPGALSMSTALDNGSVAAVRR